LSTNVNYQNVQFSPNNSYIAKSDLEDQIIVEMFRSGKNDKQVYKHVLVTDSNTCTDMLQQNL
ncbi:12990_t:CDS:1, partial [Gigaspora margarita]